MKPTFPLIFYRVICIINILGLINIPVNIFIDKQHVPDQVFVLGFINALFTVYFWKAGKMTEWIKGIIGGK